MPKFLVSMFFEGMVSREVEAHDAVEALDSVTLEEAHAIEDLHSDIYLHYIDAYVEEFLDE